MAIAFAPIVASALIMVGRGNDPVHDAGWPEGALAVANLKSRVGWWEGPPFGGGEWQFLYRGDTAAFEQALTNFAAIRAPALDVVIHDGPQENQFLKDDKDTNSVSRVDWSFTVWVPASWNRLFNDPKSVFGADQPQFRKPVAPPRLDVYVGGSGLVDWAKVKVPAGLQVRDERAAAAGVDLSAGTVVRAEFFDMDTGKPVSGVKLTVDRMSWQAGPNAQWVGKSVAEATSDAIGRVELTGLVTNNIRLTATAQGYAPRQLAWQTITRPTLLKFTVELAKAASILGVALDTDGKPVKGVKVRGDTPIGSNGLGYPDGRNYLPSDQSSVETDSKGRFELKNQPAGYAQLYASAPGYTFSDVTTIHDVPSSNVLLRLTRAGGVFVKITDRSGKALSKFEGNPLIIEIEPKGGSTIGSWGGSATVKDDGTYEFSTMPPGEYRVTSRPNPSNSNRRYAAEQIVEVKPGARTEVKVVYE